MDISTKSTAYTLISMASKFQEFFHGDAGDVLFKYMGENNEVSEATVPNIAKIINTLSEGSSDVNSLLKDYYKKTDTVGNSDMLSNLKLLATMNDDGSFLDDGIFKIKTRKDGSKELVGILDTLAITESNTMPPVVDILKDGSTLALITLDNNCYDSTGVYNGYWEGNESYTGCETVIAGKFDGSSGVNLSDYDLSDVNSISVWFKWDGKRGTRNWSTLLGSKRINSSNDNIKLAVVHNRLATYHNRRAQYLSDTISKNTIYNVIINKNDDGNYDYYLNNEEIALDKPDNNATLDLFYIGSDNGNGSVNEAFTGAMCYVRLFNKQLNQDERSIVYNERNL